MIVEYDKSFDKSLGKLKDRDLISKLEKLIIQLELSSSLSELTGIKKLSGFKAYYRIRIGDHRLGFEKLDDSRIRIIVVANRKDIYKIFP